MGPSCKGRKKECKAEPCIRKRKHGVFALLVDMLKSLIQAKYQSIKASPFDSHDVILSVLLVAIFTYATASVAEVMLLARESPYCTLVGNLRLFAGALAAISLLSILDPILGFITAAVWACLFMAVAYESRTEVGNISRVVTDKLIDIFTRLAASVRSRDEQPNLYPSGRDAKQSNPLLIPFHNTHE